MLISPNPDIPVDAKVNKRALFEPRGTPKPGQSGTVEIRPVS